MLKKNAKMQKRELKYLQHRCQEIGSVKDRIKINTEKVAAENWLKAQQLKEETIKKEIAIINKKDDEARKLGLHESEILKRLRETHIRQQQALQEIQDMFQKNQLRPQILLNESSHRSVQKLLMTEGDVTFSARKQFANKDITENRDQKGKNFTETEQPNSEGGAI